jgi:hypothetical protein
MKRYESYGEEDTSVAVMCDCPGNVYYPINADGSTGEQHYVLEVDDRKIWRCEFCGRGYKTELIVWQYEPEEEDANPTA